METSPITQDELNNFFSIPSNPAEVSRTASNIVLAPFADVQALGDEGVILRNALSNLQISTNIRGTVDETAIADELQKVADQVISPEKRSVFVAKMAGKVASWLAGGQMGPVGGAAVDLVAQQFVDRTIGPALENVLIRTGQQVTTVRWRRLLAERGAKPILGALGVLSTGLISIAGNSIYNINAGLSGESEQYINDWYESMGNNVAETMASDGGPVQIEFLTDEINEYNATEYEPPVQPSKNLPNLAPSHGTRAPAPPPAPSPPPPPPPKDEKKLPGVELREKARALVSNIDEATLKSMSESEIVRVIRASNLEIRELEDILQEFNRLGKGKKGSGNKGSIQESIRVAKKMLKVAKETKDEDVKIAEVPVKPTKQEDKKPTKQQATKAAYEFVRASKLSEEYDKKLKAEIDELFKNSIVAEIEKKVILKNKEIHSFNKQFQRATRPHERGLKVFFNQPSNFI